MDMFRQGDVLVMKGRPDMRQRKRVEPRGGRLILAEGEATGHHHSIAAGRGVTMFRPDDMPAGGGGFRLNVSGGCVQLTHQEHDTLIIPPGRYDVVQQRVYDPAVFARAVAD